MLSPDEWATVRSQALRALAPTNSLEGLLAYGELVFGYRAMHHHIEMLGTILEAIYTRQDTLILMPAGSAKTTWGNTIFLSWLVGMIKDVRIGLFSQTTDFGEAFSGAIMNTVESNEEYQEVFGHIANGGKWTQKAWLRKGSRWAQSKDLTVFAGGTGGQVASKRFDVLLCDDILGRENTETVDQREKAEIWFNQTLYPRLVASGVCIVLGTRWAEGDLYEKLMTPVEEGGYGFRTVVKKALLGDLDGPKENLTSYWPDVWPVEKLLERRARNPAMFDCTYQNDIFGLVSGDTFQKRWIQFYGTHDGDPDLELPPGRQWTKRMGVDLASSTRERADWTARVTTAESWGDGEFYIMQVHRDKIPDGHAAFIDQGYRDILGIALVVCENNQFQSTVIQEVASTYPQIPIVGRRADVDKRTRAQAVAEKFRLGKVWVHKSLEGSAFIREMLAFDGVRGHDDMIDAMGYSMELGGGTFFFGAVRSR
jgi:phage terminase large subunit-like protein